MTAGDRRFAREVESHYNSAEPWRPGSGWRWQAAPYVPGWVQVRPVYSRWRDLISQLKGRPRNAYLGGYTFVRRRDGLVVEVGSNPSQFLAEVFPDVLREIGETAGAEQIVAEIAARTDAYWRAVESSD